MNTRLYWIGLFVALVAFSAPTTAGITSIDFETDTGLLTDQSGTGTLTALDGRAVFSNANVTYLEEEGSLVTANGQVSITMTLRPYSDATNGVGLIMADASDPDNTVTAICDSEGNIVLTDYFGLTASTYFSYPAAPNNQLTLTYNTLSGQATVTIAGSTRSATRWDALASATNVIVGVVALGPGGFEDVSATGNGIPDYPGGVTVPDVVGMTQAAATSAITTAGLTVGTVTTVYSDTVPAGQVISQNPIAGASATSGSAVSFVVSLGPQDTDGDGVPDDEDAFPANPRGQTDLDADGIGDEWEMRYFSDLDTADETSDYDSDGISDREEFDAWALGLDPTDGTSQLPVSGILGLAALCLAIGGAAVRRR